MNLKDKIKKMNIEDKNVLKRNIIFFSFLFVFAFFNIFTFFANNHENLAAMVNIEQIGGSGESASGGSSSTGSSDLQESDGDYTIDGLYLFNTVCENNTDGQTTSIKQDGTVSCVKWVGVDDDVPTLSNSDYIYSATTEINRIFDVQSYSSSWVETGIDVWSNSTPSITDSTYQWIKDDTVLAQLYELSYYVPKWTGTNNYIYSRDTYSFNENSKNQYFREDSNTYSMFKEAEITLDYYYNGTSFYWDSKYWDDDFYNKYVKVTGTDDSSRTIYAKQELVGEKIATTNTESYYDTSSKIYYLYDNGYYYLYDLSSVTTPSYKWLDQTTGEYQKVSEELRYIVIPSSKAREYWSYVESFNEKYYDFSKYETGYTTNLSSLANTETEKYYSNNGNYRMVYTYVLNEPVYYSEGTLAESGLWYDYATTPTDTNEYYYSTTGNYRNKNIFTKYTKTLKDTTRSFTTLTTGWNTSDSYFYVRNSSKDETYYDWYTVTSTRKVGIESTGETGVWSNSLVTCTNGVYSNGNCYTKVASTTEKIYEIYNVTTNYEKDTSTKTLVSDWVLGTTNSATGNYDYHEQEQGNGTRTKTTIGTNGWINSTSTTKYVQNGTASTLEEDTGDTVYQWSNKSTVYKNQYQTVNYETDVGGSQAFVTTVDLTKDFNDGKFYRYNGSDGNTYLYTSPSITKTVTTYYTKKTYTSLYSYPIYLCTKNALSAWSKASCSFQGYLYSTSSSFSSISGATTNWTGSSQVGIYNGQAVYSYTTSSTLSASVSSTPTLYAPTLYLASQNSSYKWGSKQTYVTLSTSTAESSSVTGSRSTPYSYILSTSNGSGTSGLPSESGTLGSSSTYIDYIYRRVSMTDALQDKTVSSYKWNSYTTNYANVYLLKSTSNSYTDYETTAQSSWKLRSEPSTTQYTTYTGTYDTYAKYSTRKTWGVASTSYYYTYYNPDGTLVKYTNSSGTSITPPTVNSTCTNDKSCTYGSISTADYTTDKYTKVWGYKKKISSYTRGTSTKTYEYRTADPTSTYDKQKYVLYKPTDGTSVKATNGTTYIVSNTGYIYKYNKYKFTTSTSSSNGTKVRYISGSSPTNESACNINSLKNGGTCTYKTYSKINTAITKYAYDRYYYKATTSTGYTISSNGSNNSALTVTGNIVSVSGTNDGNAICVSTGSSMPTNCWKYTSSSSYQKEWNKYMKAGQIVSGRKDGTTTFTYYVNNSTTAPTTVAPLNSNGVTQTSYSVCDSTYVSGGTNQFKNCYTLKSSVKEYQYRKDIYTSSTRKVYTGNTYYSQLSGESYIVPSGNTITNTKNLFDIDSWARGLTYQKIDGTSNGYVTSSTNGYVSNYSYVVTLTANTTYTFAINANATGTASIKVNNNTITLKNNVDQQLNKQTITFTTGSDGKATIIYNSTSGTTTIYWIQIEKGSSFTGYSPYSDLKSSTTSTMSKKTLQKTEKQYFAFTKHLVWENVDKTFNPSSITNEDSGIDIYDTNNVNSSSNLNAFTNGYLGNSAPSIIVIDDETRWYNIGRTEYLYQRYNPIVNFTIVESSAAKYVNNTNLNKVKTDGSNYCESVNGGYICTLNSNGNEYVKLLKDNSSFDSSNITLGVIDGKLYASDKTKMGALNSYKYYRAYKDEGSYSSILVDESELLNVISNNSNLNNANIKNFETDGIEQTDGTEGNKVLLAVSTSSKESSVENLTFSYVKTYTQKVGVDTITYSTKYYQLEPTQTYYYNYIEENNKGKWVTTSSVKKLEKNFGLYFSNTGVKTDNGKILPSKVGWGNSAKEAIQHESGYTFIPYNQVSSYLKNYGVDANGNLLYYNQVTFGDYQFVLSANYIATNNKEQKYILMKKTTDIKVNASLNYDDLKNIDLSAEESDNIYWEAGPDTFSKDGETYYPSDTRYFSTINTSEYMKLYNENSLKLIFNDKEASGLKEKYMISSSTSEDDIPEFIMLNLGKTNNVKTLGRVSFVHDPKYYEDQANTNTSEVNDFSYYLTSTSESDVITANVYDIYTYYGYIKDGIVYDSKNSSTPEKEAADKIIEMFNYLFLGENELDGNTKISKQYETYTSSRTGITHENGAYLLDKIYYTESANGFGEVDDFMDGSLDLTHYLSNGVGATFYDEDDSSIKMQTELVEILGSDYLWLLDGKKRAEFINSSNKIRFNIEQYSNTQVIFWHNFIHKMSYKIENIDYVEGAEVGKIEGSSFYDLTNLATDSSNIVLVEKENITYIYSKMLDTSHITSGQLLINGLSSATDENSGEEYNLLTKSYETLYERSLSTWIPINEEMKNGDYMTNFELYHGDFYGTYNYAVDTLWYDMYCRNTLNGCAFGTDFSYPTSIMENYSVALNDPWTNYRTKQFYSDFYETNLEYQSSLEGYNNSFDNSMFDAWVDVKYLSYFEWNESSDIPVWTWQYSKVIDNVLQEPSDWTYFDSTVYNHQSSLEYNSDIYSYTKHNYYAVCYSNNINYENELSVFTDNINTLYSNEVETQLDKTFTDKFFHNGIEIYYCTRVSTEDEYNDISNFDESIISDVQNSFGLTQNQIISKFNSSNETIMYSSDNTSLIVLVPHNQDAYYVEGSVVNSTAKEYDLSYANGDVNAVFNYFGYGKLEEAPAYKGMYSENMWFDYLNYDTPDSNEMQYITPIVSFSRGNFANEQKQTNLSIMSLGYLFNTSSSDLPISTSSDLWTALSNKKYFNFKNVSSYSYWSSIFSAFNTKVQVISKDMVLENPKYQKVHLQDINKNFATNLMNYNLYCSLDATENDYIYILSEGRLTLKDNVDSDYFNSSSTNLFYSKVVGSESSNDDEWTIDKEPLLNKNSYKITANVSGITSANKDFNTSYFKEYEIQVIVPDISSTICKNSDNVFYGSDGKCYYNGNLFVNDDNISLNYKINDLENKKGSSYYNKLWTPLSMFNKNVKNLTIEISDLVPNTTYQILVRARYLNGQVSSPIMFEYTTGEDYVYNPWGTYLTSVENGKYNNETWAQEIIPVSVRNNFYTISSTYYDEILEKYGENETLINELTNLLTPYVNDSVVIPDEYRYRYKQEDYTYSKGRIMLELQDGSYINSLGDSLYIETGVGENQYEISRINNNTFEIDFAEIEGYEQWYKNYLTLNPNSTGGVSDTEFDPISDFILDYTKFNLKISAEDALPKNTKICIKYSYYVAPLERTFYLDLNQNNSFDSSKINSSNNFYTSVGSEINKNYGEQDTVISLGYAGGEWLDDLNYEKDLSNEKVYRTVMKYTYNNITYTYITRIKDGQVIGVLTK